jgi:hypothetical protein
MAKKRKPKKTKTKRKRTAKKNKLKKWSTPKILKKWSAPKVDIVDEALEREGKATLPNTFQCQ